MRTMFDTNILISAVFSSSGNPSKSILQAEQLGMELCICQEIQEEAFEKFEQKWPELLGDFKLFFEQAGFTVLPTPAPSEDAGDAVRDPKDRPIYRAARSGAVDYFITGDKDLLEFEQNKVVILTPAAFMETTTLAIGDSSNT